MDAVKILVTTDGSNLSDKAVETAIELARQFDGTVIGMTAVLAPPPAAGFVAEDEVVAEHGDSVAKAILECAARYDVRYIVMASRGLGTLGALLLGSETQKVLSLADRPVLVVR